MKGMMSAQAWEVAALVGIAGCAGAATQPGQGAESTAVEETPPAAAAPEPEESAQAVAKADATQPAPRPRPYEGEPDSPTKRLMRAHFSQAEAIRLAVIAGYPDKAVKKANALISTDDQREFPAGAKPHIERMKAAASRLRDSADVAQAAAATADIGVACGMCHQQFGGPGAVSAPPPAEDGSVQSRMRRHVWATEMLWEALYVPANSSWKQAVQQLQAEDTFPEELLTEGGVYARSAAKDFSRILDEAAHRSTLADRAASYAELLGTCARCHLATE